MNTSDHSCANCGKPVESPGWSKRRPIIAFEKLLAGHDQLVCDPCVKRLREAHAGPEPCKPTSEGEYCIVHASVDGAGTGHHFTRREDAIAYANWCQRRSDADGNPYRYHYAVYRRGGGEIHHTRIDPRV